jgi:hypothetical protein
MAARIHYYYWFHLFLREGVYVSGHVAHQSPPSSVEVINEFELLLLSPQAPPWRVVGLLYFLTLGVYV